jgi:hypothetical protein
LKTYVLISNLKPILYLLVYFSRDANASRLTQSLQAGSDIYPIAENSLVIEKNIPLIDPDSELHSPVRSNRSIALQHGFLNRYSALNRIQNAGELSKKAVTGRVDNPTLKTGNHWKDNTLMPFKGGNCLCLAFAHKGTVACNIGCQDCRESTSAHSPLLCSVLSYTPASAQGPECPTVVTSPSGWTGYVTIAPARTSVKIWPGCSRATEKRDETPSSHVRPSSRGAAYHIVKLGVCCASQQKSTADGRDGQEP